ncbi:hypothetical protein FHT08_000601 [Xanthomonas campestris]|nr:hypothetical protein [Xanthomonas sp. CFBP 8151]
MRIAGSAPVKRNRLRDHCLQAAGSGRPDAGTSGRSAPGRVSTRHHVGAPWRVETRPTSDPARVSRASVRRLRSHPGSASRTVPPRRRCKPRPLPKGISTMSSQPAVVKAFPQLRRLEIELECLPAQSLRRRFLGVHSGVSPVRCESAVLRPSARTRLRLRPAAFRRPLGSCRGGVPFRDRNDALARIRASLRPGLFPGTPPC